jgi:hypothetical protein
MSDIETFSFTGREVQELVDACHRLQGTNRIAMRRVRGLGEDAQAKRDAITARQAVVDGIIGKLIAPR